MKRDYSRRARCNYKKVGEAEEEDFYNYDLVCFGVPSYNWHVPKPADEFLKRKFAQYKKDGKIMCQCS